MQVLVFIKELRRNIEGLGPNIEGLGPNIEGLGPNIEGLGKHRRFFVERTRYFGNSRIMKKKKGITSEVQNKEIFKDPTEMIAVSTIHVTEVQMKTWLAMLYVSRNDFRSEKHKISIEELCKLSGYAMKDLGYLAETMKKICGTLVCFNLLGKSKMQDLGVITTLLAGVDFRKTPGIVEFSFSPMLKEMIEKSKIFARLSLAIVRDIGTKSAISLYRLMNDYRKIGQTSEIPLETIKEILGIEKEAYKDFKDFNFYVLKPACKELKEKTDLEVIPHLIRIRRKVVSIKFEIIPQKRTLLVKPKTLNQQKIDQKEIKESKNPFAHLGDIELLSSMRRVEDKIYDLYAKGEDTPRSLLDQKIKINELIKERKLKDRYEESTQETNHSPEEIRRIIESAFPSSRTA